MLPFSNGEGWFPVDPVQREMSLESLEKRSLPLREMRSMRYKGQAGLADRGMMMGLGKRVIADRGG